MFREGTRYYHRWTLQARPPSIRTNFAGFELYLGNYSAIPMLEVGPLGVWDGASRNVEWQVVLPEDAGIGSGVAHFVNGSVTVTRVSGTNFAGIWANRQLGVHTDQGAMVTISATVVPPNSLDLASPWSFATGDYNFVKYDQMSLYYVSVGPTGARRPDPTAAPVFVL
jgi:hypothetical protein